MIEVADAIARVLADVSTLEVERVELGASLGRVLGRALEAREDVPPYDNSAMDGYTLRAGDVGPMPARLRVVGESRAGSDRVPPLEFGTAMRIFTGAPVPKGADSVVLQEDVTREGDEIVLREEAAAGRHIRRQGEVLAVGERWLSPGARIDAGAVGALATQGQAQVPVVRRPVVAILSTGDELRELGEPAGAGTLVDSNVHALSAAVREAGGVPLVLESGADDVGELERRVASALDRCDLLVTTGGVSVGDYDHVPGALRAAGVEERFRKVRLKPGKPVWFGARGATRVLGLPGNPVSALVTFEVFARPLLRLWQGDGRPFRATREVELAWAARAPSGRTELARAVWDEEGRAARHGAQGSGAVTSMVGAELLVILPAGAGAVETARAIDLCDSRGSSVSAF